MISPVTDLLDILRYTLYTRNDFKNEKQKFRQWLERWVINKASVQEAFEDHENQNLNSKKIETLKVAHDCLSLKYYRYICYNYEFITDLKNYVRVVYINYLNSPELKRCIEYLEQLQQNMFYESVTSDINKGDIYPNVHQYSQNFENYGRAIMKYYNLKGIPFIIEVLLRNPMFCLDNSEKENINDESLKHHFYNFIQCITANNDKDWLYFLHGPLLNIQYAMYHHANFCNKFSNSPWSYEIEKVIEDFSNYLHQIYDCILREKYLKNIHDTPEICFPAILNIDIDNTKKNNNNNNINDKYRDYYYDDKNDKNYITSINSFPCGESYEYILKNILPLWKTRFSYK